MKRVKYIIPALLMMLGLASCENMDWLHKEYLQEGSIYAGKITDLEVEAGFERAILKWKNPKDLVSKKIRIGYGLSEVEGDYIIIDELIDQYELTGLSDYTSYFFEVATLDAYDNPSLVSTIETPMFNHTSLEGIDLPTFMIYDNSLSDKSATGFRIVVDRLSGRINFFTAIEWQVYEDGTQTLITKGELVRTQNEIDQDILQYEGTSFSVETEKWIGDYNFKAGKNYTFKYKLSFLPAIFREKTSAGVFVYDRICTDVQTIEGEYHTAVNEEPYFEGDKESYALPKSKYTWLDDPRLYGNQWSGSAPVAIVKVNGENKLVGDVYKNGQYKNATCKNGKEHYRMWDEFKDYDKGGGKDTYMNSYWESSDGYPYSVFIDMGEIVEINRVAMHFRGGGPTAYSPGIFEIWVSDDDNPEDGILEGWEKLGQYSSVGRAINYDAAYVDGYFTSLFNDATTRSKACQYVRFVAVDDRATPNYYDGNTKGTCPTTVAELTFYGVQVEVE